MVLWWDGVGRLGSARCEAGLGTFLEELGAGAFSNSIFFWELHHSSWNVAQLERWQTAPPSDPPISNVCHSTKRGYGSGKVSFKRRRKNAIFFWRSCAQEAAQRRNIFFISILFPPEFQMYFYDGKRSRTLVACFWPFCLWGPATVQNRVAMSPTSFKVRCVHLKMQFLFKIFFLLSYCACRSTCAHTKCA